RQENRPAPPPTPPSQSPPRAVRAPRDGAAGPPPSDADSRPADSPRDAPTVQLEPLAATPPWVVVFDRDTYRAQIADLFRRSNLYGVGVRDDPPAAAALIERLLDLMRGAILDAVRAPTALADTLPPRTADQG